MFILEELDKIFGKLESTFKSQSDTPKISLPNVDRINVESQLKLTPKVLYSSGSIMKQLLAINKLSTSFDISRIVSSKRYLTTDLLFASMMESYVLKRLATIPERHYASAKLMICDRESYDAVMKLMRISSRYNQSKYFIYRRPFGITAILLLQDVVDTIDRTRKPVLTMKENQSTGQPMGFFNYNIVKETFPFLKMCDMIVVLSEIGDLRLKAFHLGGHRYQQILQYLSHFARSTHMIELQPITKQLGHQNSMYDNVSIFAPTSSDAGPLLGAFKRLPLTYLPTLAYRLNQLSQQLKLNIQTITYRDADPSGDTKLFAQLAATTASKETDQQVLVPAKVLVLDRFFDIQGPFLHADRYAPFIEQEIVLQSTSGSSVKTDLFDELGERLGLEKLTDVLGAILNYTINLKPLDTETAGNANNAGKTPRALNETLLSSMSASQSIRRHMEMIGSVYKHLNEGYLLILRLETSLVETMNQLRALSAPLKPNQQEQLVDRLIRIYAAFKQLAQLSGNSIRPLDLIRVACCLIDVINVFLRVHSSAPNTRDGQQTMRTTPQSSSSSSLSSGGCRKILENIKVTSILGKEFRSLIKARLDSMASTTNASPGGGLAAGEIFSSNAGQYDEENLQVESLRLLDKLREFDQVSKTSSGYRATLSLEEIIEKFQFNQLDAESYPTISARVPSPYPTPPTNLTSPNLTATTTNSTTATTNTTVISQVNAIPIIVFLTTLSHGEVGRIKLLECSLKRGTNSAAQAIPSSLAPSGDIIIIASGLRRPEDFLKSL